MLQVWEIQDRHRIQEWLDQLNLSGQTWLLSDLRTKFEIQNYYLNKQGFFLEESVLRISDLWKKILLRSHPDYKVMTQPTALLHLKFFLRHHGGSIGLPEASEKTLLKWMSDLAPLYFHPEGEAQLLEWFTQNPDQSWRDWWLRAKAAFSYFLEKKQLMASWIPSFLQSLNDVSSYWEKDLFVDLGGQLSYVEAELLQQISKKREVVILSPHLRDSEKHTELLQPYEYLKGFADKIQKISPQQQMSKIKNHKSFSSTLGSIRQATAQIREWLEQGISQPQIALVAPEIESLWPVLAFHLDQEGILYNKSRVSSFQSSVPVQFFYPS